MYVLMSDRTQQVFCHQCSDDHVLRKFSWGNRQSLKDAPAEKGMLSTHCSSLCIKYGAVTTTATIICNLCYTGVDVQSILRSFYRRHYHPCAMKMVVVGPQSLAELEQAVLASAGDWQAEPIAMGEVCTVDFRHCLMYVVCNASATLRRTCNQARGCLGNRRDMNSLHTVSVK